MNMGTSLRRYYRGHTLATMSSDLPGQKRHYHFDHQGTTQCLTDQTGAVTDRFASNAWGVQVKRTGTSINRHWYLGSPGYYGNAVRSLYNDRARYIETGDARYLSRNSDGGFLYGVTGGQSSQVPGAPCSAAACHLRRPGLDGMKEIIDWLGGLGPKYPKCDRVKLGCTIRLLQMIGDHGARPYPLATKYLRHWLSGKDAMLGIPFDTLMSDSQFRATYNYLSYRVRETGCRTGTFSECAHGEFSPWTDLYFAMHQYELCVKSTSGPRTNMPCGVCPTTGRIRVLKVLFTYKDPYDWSVNEATPFPYIGKFHQKWAVDLRDCCSGCCKDFWILSDRHATMASCCSS